MATRADKFILYSGDDSKLGLESEYASFTAWADTLKDNLGAAIPWYTAVGNHDSSTRVGPISGNTSTTPRRCGARASSRAIA